MQIKGYEKNMTRIDGWHTFSCIKIKLPRVYHNIKLGRVDSKIIYLDKIYK